MLQKNFRVLFLFANLFINMGTINSCIMSAFLLHLVRGIFLWLWYAVYGNAKGLIKYNPASIDVFKCFILRFNDFWIIFLYNVSSLL